MEFADQCTSKRLVRTAMAAIRDGHKEGEAAEELDILPFFQRTSLFPSAILKRAIQAACDEIDDELGILVKDEFETFVRLFDRICKGGTGEYEELSDRVAGLVHALQVLVQRTEGELAMLESAMAECRNAAWIERRQHYLDHIGTNLERIEQSLHRISCEDPPGSNGRAKSGSSAALQDHSRLEVTSLLFAFTKSSIQGASSLIDLPSAIISRMASITEAFFSLLDESLLAALTPQSVEGSAHNLEAPSAWTSVAAIHVRLQKFKPLEEAFLESVWRPFLAKIISKVHWGELCAQAKEGSADEEAIGLLYGELYEAVSLVKRNWIDALPPPTAWPEGQRQAFVVRCTLKELFSRLSAELGGLIQSPALPDVFYRNFTASEAFIGRLGGLFDGAHLSLLYAMDTFKAFTSSWQVNVYFQLRFRQLSAIVEEQASCMAGPVEELFDTASQASIDRHPIFLAIAAVHAQIVGPPPIVLRPLRAKFVRFIVQMLARVSQAFIDSIVEGENDPLCLSRCWRAACNHSWLISYSKDLCGSEARSTHQALYGGLDPQVTALLIERFIKQLTERQSAILELLNKVVSGRTAFIIESLTVDATSPIDALGVLDRLLVLDEPFGFTRSAPFDVKRSAEHLAKLFGQKALALIEKSHRALSKYNRLRAIVKDSEEVNGPVGDGENGRGAVDAAQQQERLFATLRSEVDRLRSHPLVASRIGEGELAQLISQLCAELS